jgi:23S rRNA (guanosine2251-2'-O)-methyltransferase
VAKSAAGATEHVKISKVPNLNRLIQDLKNLNIWVVGTSVDAEIDHTEWDWSRRSALVLGGEGKGLHRLVAENCDVLVKIPMYGKIESLNVSVAAGVILFEARRQRAQRTTDNEQRTIRNVGKKDLDGFSFGIVHCHCPLSIERNVLPKMRN